VGLVAVLAVSACRHERRPASVPLPEFVDVTEAAGVARVSATYDAAVGDVDGDGALDLYVGNHGAGAVLFRNGGDGHFTDVRPSSGIEPGGDQHGSGLADYDGDGRLDLIVTLGAGRGLAVKQNRLYHNEGEWRFQDRGGVAGVADPTGRSRSVALFDADRDGRLDVLLANFATPNRLLRNTGDGAFEDVSDRFGISELSATHVAWTDVDGDGYPDVLLSGTPKGLRFLHNAGGQRFEDWTVRVGLSRESGSVQAMAFGDYDNDGALDLYMSYGSDFSDVALEHDDGRITFAFFAREGPSGLDFESSGSGETLRVDLYENGGPVAPERVTCAGVRHVGHATFECARADANGVAPAGDLGFFLWQDARSGTPCASCPAVSSWHLQWRGSGDHHLSGILYASRRPVPHGFQRPPATGGVLWKGDASGGFERVSMASLAHDGNGQAVQWADVDNDGLLDLYVVDSGVDGAGGRNRLFVQTPEHDFVAVPSTSGASPPSGDGRGVGAHFFDFDGDGRQDLFLTNGWGAPPFDQGPYRLLRNASPPKHWLDVVLQGRASNRQGLGARVEVEACGTRQLRLHNGGSNFYSQSAIPPHFGLGDCGQVGKVRVRWPSGVQQDVRDVAADQVLRVQESEGR
jgi:hypothetical protein